jgi:hypothetical protein
MKSEPVFCGKRIRDDLLEVLRFSRDALLLKVEAHVMQIIQEEPSQSDWHGDHAFSTR